MAAALETAGSQGAVPTGDAAAPPHFVVPQRAKDAFKVALALVLAYGISLTLGWGNQHWAGLAVAMCGLTAAGDSLNKGLLRVCATLVAVLCTLVYVSLFTQDRWLLLLCFTTHTAFCTYMVGGTSRWYFWCVLGFTPAILALSGGGESVPTFDIVILRAQETMLGVLIYSLVSVFIWPQSSHEPFLKSVRTLLDMQRQLTADTLARTRGRAEDEGNIAAVWAQSEQLIGGLNSGLDGAELDAPEIWERRHSWRGLVAKLPLLNSSLAQWKETLQELQTLELERIVPGLTAAGEELDRRFVAIEQLLSGAESVPATSPVDLSVDSSAFGELDHFNRAVVMSLQERLRSVDNLTAALLDDAIDIQRVGGGEIQKPRARASSRPWSLDPDRLIYSLRNFCTVWIGISLWMWLPGFPKGLTICLLLNSATISMALMPTVSGRVVLVPGILSILFAGSLHMLLMPKLSGFLELGTMLFFATFLLVYLSPLPKHFVSRPISLAVLVMVTSIANEQSYSFTSVAGWLILFMIVTGVLIISGHFPFSMRAEDLFLRQLRRFLRGCAFISATRHELPLQASWLAPVNRWRSAFHHNQASMLPGRLINMGKSLTDESLKKEDRDSLEAMLAEIPVLAHRLEDLSIARDALDTARPPPRVLEELDVWADTLTKLFADLSEDPARVDHARLQQALSRREERMEALITSAMKEAGGQTSSQDAQVVVYRMLGALRAISIAFLRVAEQAAQIDWRWLRESRF